MRNETLVDENVNKYERKHNHQKVTKEKSVNFMKLLIEITYCMDLATMVVHR